ncbi:MAG: hypothetical protein ACRD8U_00560 [Pyrinomonadaceae bacterium]
MHPMKQPANLEERYRTLVILWFALFVSIVMFLFLAVFVAPETERPNSLMTLTFMAVGMAMVVVSYIVKQKFLAQSVEKQEVVLVQTGTIISAALNEVAAMLGLMDRFITGTRNFYALFIFAVIGALLNFPRRDHLLAAGYKKPLS